MGITLEARPTSDYPQQLLLTLACDGCGSMKQLWSDPDGYVGCYRLAMKAGWLERRADLETPCSAEAARQFLGPCCSGKLLENKMETPTKFSMGDMISKYREIKDIVEAEEAKLAEQLKPYKQAMLALQTACGVELQAQKAQNFKAEDGTAYLKHTLSVKVDNQPEFLKFVRSTERWDMLAVKADDEALFKYADQQNPATGKEDFMQEAARLDAGKPPGVTLTPSITCIIRK